MLAYLAAEGGEAEHNPIIPLWQEIVVGIDRLRAALLRADEVRLPADGEDVPARVDAIEGGIKRAEEAQAEANELLEQYKAQLAEARTEAARIRDEARADAEGIRQDVLGQGAGGVRPHHRGRPGAARRRARRRIVRELRAEVGTLAVDLASRIVGESLADEARSRGTVDRFLAELDAGTGRRAALMEAASRESYAAAVGAARRGRPPRPRRRSWPRSPTRSSSVAGLLAREPRLRRALADPSRSGERAGRAARARCSPARSATTRVDAARRRWSRGRWSAAGRAARRDRAARRRGAARRRRAGRRAGRGRGRAVPLRAGRRRRPASSPRALSDPTRRPERAGRAGRGRCSTARPSRSPCGWSRLALRRLRRPQLRRRR